MPFEQKKKNPLLTAWISNCGVSTNNRIGLLQGLIDAGISTRNYGGCRLRGETNTEPALDQEFIASNPTWKAIRGEREGERQTMLTAEKPIDKTFQIAGAQPITVGYDAFLKGGASLFFYGAENRFALLVCLVCGLFC